MFNLNIVEFAFRIQLQKLCGVFICSPKDWTMEADFHLNRPNIAYDVHYELDDGKTGDGTFLISFLTIVFHIEIKFTKTEGVVKSSIEYFSVNAGGNQYDIEIKTYPKTPYNDVITREVCTVFSVFGAGRNFKENI